MPFRTTDLEAFTTCLAASNRIVAFCGAGLSHASGLPTFRGLGGLWKSYEAMSLATPEAFARDPSLVWQFYSMRRHKALQAKPNRAHYALAALARRKPEFITISQNVDGLSPRANHPLQQLYLLHGSLFTIRCTSFYCKHVAYNDFSDPIVPALAVSEESFSTYGKEDEDDSPVPEIPIQDLPHCPSCKTGLLRPGVVWFGEALPSSVIHSIDDYLMDTKPGTSERRGVDLCIVIGTSMTVYPAAAYVERIKMQGAKVAVVNIDRREAGFQGVDEGIVDWWFEGDAAEVVPEILKGVIGELAVSDTVERTSFETSGEQTGRDSYESAESIRYG